MNAQNLKGATAHGVARIRELADGWTLINIPDKETTIIVANASRLFDLSACHRLSRGAAHRIVNSMTDATPAVKSYYHGLIDAAKEVSK